MESKSGLSISNPVGGPKKKTVMDGIITGLFGPSTDEMTPERARSVEAERAQDQNAAYSLARSAATNPGEQFMGPPASVGSDGKDLLSTIGKIFSMFGGGGGAGA